MIDTMTSFHIVDNVSCTSVEKRTYPHKHYVYCLNVRWSDGVQSAIYRKYSSFFDFQTQLRDELKTREDLTVPELPALRLFERENRVGKDTAEKRRKKIEDFCRQALSLPPEVICKPSVTSFFEQWPTDEPRDGNQPPKEGQNTHGLATKILKLFEDNKLQKKFTSLTKGISVDKQHKRSSSTGNVIESSAEWHLSHGPGGSSVLSQQKSCHGSADQLEDASLKPSRRGSDSEVIDGQYKVISDYDQRMPNELTLKEGDIVEVVDKLISGWWLVQVADANNGGSIKQGWAPGSCLEPVGVAGQTEISLIVTEAPHQGIGSLFKALNDCTAQDEDEVSFTKGQEVVVLETNMDGWWLVQVNGRKGLTPAANLEQVIDEDEEGDDLYDHIRFMKTSQREYQLYKKAPPPRRSSTLRKTKPLVNIRNSDMDDYAEIGDFSDLGEEKSEADISSAPKHPYVTPKAHSVSDPTGPVGQMSSIDAGDTTNAIYAQIDKTKKTNNELKKRGPLKTGTSGHYVNCDHVVSGGPRPTIPERQYSQSELRNERSATEVEKEAEAQGTAGLQYVNVEIGSKTASYSRHPTSTAAYAEITPGITVPKMPSEMRRPAPTPVNVKPFNIRSEVSDSPPTSQRVNEKPLKPGKKKNIDDRSQPWYVGHMSRQDSEHFLKKHARQNEFLVRESFKKPGDFTISVFHNQRVRHFRIERTTEGQFLIGKHNFLRVKDVVMTYQKQPLFVDDNEIGVLLTNPVSTASFRLPVV